MSSRIGCRQRLRSRDRVKGNPRALIPGLQDHVDTAAGAGRRRDRSGVSAKRKPERDPDPLEALHTGYVRHLSFDSVLDPGQASDRERFAALAHSIRDRLAARWLATERAYART